MSIKVLAVDDIISILFFFTVQFTVIEKRDTRKYSQLRRWNEEWTEGRGFKETGAKTESFKQLQHRTV